MDRKKSGIGYVKGSVLTKRTIMTEDLKTLLEYMDEDNATIIDFKKAIIEQNCLHKRTESNRRYTLNYLTNLYSLDFSELIFRGLKYYIKKDNEFNVQLAALSAFSRDSIFAASYPHIKELAYESTATKRDFETFMDEIYPGRFSGKMTQSLVRNLLSSWSQSGHLKGHKEKIRIEVEASVASVSYALFLGLLSGLRGQNLFLSKYITFLDCSFDRAIELAEMASMRGWLDLNKVGDVIEVKFPDIISAQEMENLYE